MCYWPTDGDAKKLAGNLVDPKTTWKKYEVTVYRSYDDWRDAQDALKLWLERGTDGDVEQTKRRRTKNHRYFPAEDVPDSSEDELPIRNSFIVKGNRSKSRPSHKEQETGKGGQLRTSASEQSKEKDKKRMRMSIEFNEERNSERISDDSDDESGQDQQHDMGNTRDLTPDFEELPREKDQNFQDLVLSKLTKIERELDALKAQLAVRQVRREVEEVRGETWQGPRSCLAELEQLEKEIEDPAKKHKLKKNLKDKTKGNVVGDRPQKTVSATIDALMSRKLQTKINIYGRGPDGRKGVKKDFRNIYSVIEQITLESFKQTTTTEIERWTSFKLKNSLEYNRKKLAAAAAAALPATAPVATAPVATAPVATAPVATAPVATAPVATTPDATVTNDDLNNDSDVE